MSNLNSAKAGNTKTKLSLKREVIMAAAKDRKPKIVFLSEWTLYQQKIIATDNANMPIPSAGPLGRYQLSA